jgi:hypothetical protein
MTGLEILNKVAYGHTLFHCDDDAWDLIDRDELVAAVLCPRSAHLSISPLKEPAKRVRVGKKIPYQEVVHWKIREDAIDEGIAVLQALYDGTEPPTPTEATRA